MLLPPTSCTCTLPALTTTRGMHSATKSDVPPIAEHGLFAATSHNSTPRNQNETATFGRSTILKWSTGSTCRRSLTGGGTTPIVLHKPSRKSRFSRRSAVHVLSTRSRSPILDYSFPSSHHRKRRTRRRSSFRRRRRSRHQYCSSTRSRLATLRTEFC